MVVRPLENGRNSDRQSSNMGRVINSEPVLLGPSDRVSAFFLTAFDWLTESYPPSHRPCCLVTPPTNETSISQPSCVTMPPLGYLGKWGGSWDRWTNCQTCMWSVRSVLRDKKDGGSLLMEVLSGWVIHYFLRILVYGVNPVLGSPDITLLAVDQDGDVHLMHLIFSVLFSV